MRIFAGILLLFFSLALRAQNPAPPETDAWQSLSFLEGTWEAKTGSGSGITSAGTYSFRPELGGHILARHSITAGGCKGPATFDCDHGDLLYIYRDAPGQPLRAIYFDNEGHVIHYEVSTPSANSAVLLSDGSQPGPQFRLVYELKDSIMSGKFQVKMPGQTEWKSYLEWSGAKHS
jgi:hypothetical protein